MRRGRRRFGVPRPRHRAFPDCHRPRGCQFRLLVEAIPGQDLVRYRHRVRGRRYRFALRVEPSERLHARAEQARNGRMPSVTSAMASTVGARRIGLDACNLERAYARYRRDRCVTNADRHRLARRRRRNQRNRDTGSAVVRLMCLVRFWLRFIAALARLLTSGDISGTCRVPGGVQRRWRVWACGGGRVRAASSWPSGPHWGEPAFPSPEGQQELGKSCRRPTPRRAPRAGRREDGWPALAPSAGGAGSLPPARP